MSMTSPAKFYHVIQIVLYMCSCDQSLVTISIREVIIISILSGFDQKNHFFDGWSWFKFNNLGLALGMNLKFYTSVAKELKLKVRKFQGLVLPFVEVTEVTEEKLVAGPFVIFSMLGASSYNFENKGKHSLIVSSKGQNPPPPFFLENSFSPFWVPPFFLNQI